MQTSTAPPLVRATGLVKRFGTHRAVDDVSFALEPGELTCLLGPNGAGKTTVIRMLLGLTTPTSGSCLIQGRRYRDLDRPLTVVGSLLDGPAAHPGRSGRSHLRSLALSNGIDPGRVEEVLAEVGLSDAAGRRVGGYSLGMRQRLGLAAALLGDPPVLVLDEPGNGLDPEALVWLRRIVRAQADGGRLVMLSSHLLTEVAAIADRVVVIAAGRLVADGTATGLLQDEETLEAAYLRLVGPSSLRTGTEVA
jgi:ABC-2 type transport system ATP-binding protein